MATSFAVTTPLSGTVVTITDAGAFVAARSSQLLNPMSVGPCSAMPASVLIGAAEPAQARSDGVPAGPRRAAIAAATTGTSARTWTAYAPGGSALRAMSLVMWHGAGVT